MGQATLTRILDDIKKLTPDELRHVQHAVEQQLALPQASPEEERFLETLRTSGLVKEIKRPPRESPIERPLVSIQGKPLSETIIEERR